MTSLVRSMVRAVWPVMATSMPARRSSVVEARSSLTRTSAPGPSTSNVERIYPFQVLLTADATGLARDSKAQAEQVRCVAVERIGERIGTLASTDIAALDEALRLHLAL